MTSAGSGMATRPLFQEGDGGSIPTSAHKLVFQKIGYREAMDFVITHHYLHRTAPTSYSFGAVWQRELVGVLTIGKPASHTLINGVAGKENGHRVYELNRLVLLDEMPKNSESRFIGWCLRQLPKDLILVSYADTAFGHTGIVYKATGWKYTGTSIPFTDKTIEGLDHRSVPKTARKNNPNLITKTRSKKHRYVKCINGDYSVIKWKITPTP